MIFRTEWFLREAPFDSFFDNVPKDNSWDDEENGISVTADYFSKIIENSKKNIRKMISPFEFFRITI